MSGKSAAGAIFLTNAIKLREKVNELLISNIEHQC